MNITGFSALVALGCGLTAQAPAALAPAQQGQLPPPATNQVRFARDIKPILATSCVPCHGRGRVNGDFALDTRASLLQGGKSGPAVVIGRSADSHLIELVSGLNPDRIMPNKGTKLTPAQVGLLRAWIDQGLAWEDGVSFSRPPARNLKPHRPVLPGITASSGSNPIDRLLAPYFEQHGFVPLPPVTDRVFARRVYLDVTGLLPPVAKLREFEEDQQPDKHQRLVRQQLSDHRGYADHWLSFWNDLLRNDYRGTGYVDDGRKQISAWLYGALFTNKPFDRFVAELVNPGLESEGFVNGIVWRGVVNASQKPPMQAAQGISQVFMGVNLKCASCHDSFINDWTLADAYGMASIYAGDTLEIFKCDKPTGKTASVKFLYPDLGLIPADATAAEKRACLADLLISRDNGRLTRTVMNRLWAKLFGRGLVEPLDDMEQLPWHQDLLDWLAEDLADHQYDLKHALEVILTSRVYQLPAVSLSEQKSDEFVFRGPGVRRMTAEQFRDALATLTGAWFDTPVAPMDFALDQDPKILTPRTAHWIWNATNANVSATPGTVYFRRTFVLETELSEASVAAAADNSYTLFVNGKQALSGKDFTQPNYADIKQHVQKGENVLAVSVVNKKAEGKSGDPGNNPAGFILYARLRHGDQIYDLTTDNSWRCTTNQQSNWERPGQTLEQARPVVALGPPEMAPWNLGRKLAGALSTVRIKGRVRASLVPSDALMTALGRPNREQVNTSRPSTATTLEALEVTNGDTVARELSRGGSLVLAQAGDDYPGQLTRTLFLAALGRNPTTTETRLAEEFLGSAMTRDAVEDFVWSLMMLPEFQLIY